ncbi:MAG: hypothetical protein CM15mP8_3860 [Methanobacteriota archaeon]|nr:MAG: hypothetical protein CM15mP8_3860 [Euryarchaeota archaeon]
MKTTEQNIPKIDKKIIYQERYSSENQTGTITVKPIKATKDIIYSPIDVKDETIEEVIEQPKEDGMRHKFLMLLHHLLVMILL